MLFYVQSTGELWDGETLLATGYAGRAPALNDPAKDHVLNTGPLPRGRYVLGNAANGTHLGPVAIPLLPIHANNMHGRGGFYIHADNAQQNHSASEGCIVVPIKARQVLAERFGQYLDVFAVKP